MKIKTLLTRPAITTEPATPLRDARALMHRRGIRHLPVIDHHRLVGMLTERDIERADVSSIPEIARHDWPSALAGLVVADVMARDPLALHPETPVAEAARLARDRRVDAFAVVDSDEIAGVVTRSDLLAVLSGLLEHRHPTGLGHVLAATSLRSGSRRALGEALRIGATTGARVTALHVLPAAGRMPGFEGATAEDVVTVERARRHIADEAMAMLRAGGGQDVRCEVAEGPVAREIAQRAEELDADLIVIGSAVRRGGLGGFAATLGDRLARLAPCPVLAVPRIGARDASR
jgi:CBS domain-containing protein/nucleotide-binding universal stress UspA family protein